MPFHFQFDTPGWNVKSVHLAANGEIYNHTEIYERLERDGWTAPKQSLSDCEVIGHAYAKYGGVETAKMLDGMFSFVIFEEDPELGTVRAFAARDPVGIKPLYYGRTPGGGEKAGAYVFSSELKGLVGHVDPATVVAVPPGHCWTPEGGLECYHDPEWLRNEDHSPWKSETPATDDEIRAAFTKAVSKRMMADVDYGLFLSGGVDSCIVAHDLLPLYRRSGDDRPLKTYTVGMENSPDLTAAQAMVSALGGEKYVDHRVRTFTPDEVFDLIPKIVYHMETYEAELLRSAIPNWLLAERAAADVKMVLTGEGADEIFAGYLYFQDAENPDQIQRELRRIYGMLGNINLHRTDRMTMAHGLEARVPFLDTEFTRLVMGVDPARKIVDKDAVRENRKGREKTMLREMYAGPNMDGDSIPETVLWRAKAMQCEGVGEDWVSILQRKIAGEVSDAEMDAARENFPVNTPQTKEELYYRKIYDDHFGGMEHVVKLWEGGGRAMGAEWENDTYTREGLKDTNLLSHGMQQARGYSTSNSKTGASPARRHFSSAAAVTSPAVRASEEFRAAASAAGFNEFEGYLTSGADDRSLILDAGTNKYHIRPQPIDKGDIFRGSCTGNPPTERGYNAAKHLFHSELEALSQTELDLSLRDVFADQRARLSNLLSLPPGAEIVLVPSGSDAEYLPLAIARSIQSNPKIANGITQLQEIGAGSAPAAKGEYFSTHTPLTGLLPPKTKKLTGFQSVTGVDIPARSPNGTARNATLAMDEFLTSAASTNSYPIVHGVFGGKTGLRDASMPPSLDQGATSLGVVDACQARFSKEELHGWLAQDSIVLFTASKFFQAPPFCGAVVIPGSIARKLREGGVPQPEEEIFGEGGLGGFVTDKELPRCMRGWKMGLRREATNNVGLALRWEAGLAGMGALDGVTDAERTAAVEAWAANVSGMVDLAPELDAWCVERSIVSIRVAKGDGTWRSMTELRDLYRWMAMDVSAHVPGATEEERVALGQTAYIGQPVDVAESHAIVRIALGVESMLGYLEDREGTLGEDRLAVAKIAAIGRYFDVLKESGV